jgi:hypothetical protein
MTEKQDKPKEPTEAPSDGSPAQPPRPSKASMLLSERPSPTSSASLLSLANAYVAASGGANQVPPAPSSSPAPPPSSPASSQVPPSGESVDHAQEMRDKFSLGDYTGALAIAETLLANEAHRMEAERCAQACRAVLEKMYAARLGPLSRVPHVVVPREQLRWLSIDHRAGFVLSHVDGVSSLEMILDVSGMPTLDVLRILHRLLQERIIAVR